MTPAEQALAFAIREAAEYAARGEWDAADYYARAAWRFADARRREEAGRP